MLIDCHECGGKVSTEASACPHCGAPPMRSARTVTRNVQPAKLSEPYCPSCGAADIRNVSLLFEAGTTTKSRVAIGGTQHGELSGVVLRGTEQSPLASRLHPPEDPSGSAGRWGCLAAIVALLATAVSTASAGSIALFFLFVVPLGAGVGVYLYYLSDARPTYERQMERWRSQWTCTKCGHVFER